MKLYKYKSLKNEEKREHTYDILRNNRLHCSDIIKLNDPFEGLFGMKYLMSINRETAEKDYFVKGDWKNFSSSDLQADAVNVMVKNKKICSLSKKKDDVLLWTHYADEHRGILIEMDVSDADILFVQHCADKHGRIPVDNAKKIYEIDYQASLAKIIHGSQSKIIDNQAMIVLTTKLSFWGYEEEFRIIQQDEYYRVENKIKRVYCGYKIDPRIYNEMEVMFQNIHFLKEQINDKKPWITFVDDSK